MISMILGRKIGMTQVWDENDNVVPVTVIQAGPCAVSQVKTKATDGYDAVQIGFGSIKAGEVVLNLSGASAFYADLAYVDDMTVTARDASYAGIDGDIQKCSMTLENASRFSRISESKNNALKITTLDCFLYNSSSATLYSDGYVNGTLDGASSITLSGDADCSSVICSGNSSVIRQ